MDRHPTDQQSPSVPRFPTDNHHRNTGPIRHTVEQAPSTHSQVRVDNAETDCAGTHLVPSDHGETKCPEQTQTDEHESTISDPAPLSPISTHGVAPDESACSTPSSTPPSQTQASYSNAPAAIVQTHQTPPIPPKTSCSTASVAKLHQPPPLRMSESLGLEGCAGIIGGFIGILGVFGFLTFLWFGYGSAPEAAKATWVWRQLAIRNWMPRAVTLASIILRFIIGTQATICTSMIAALLLERLSVPRFQVARASVMRGINDGPFKLVMLVLSYKGQVWYILRHLEAWLIISAALLSIALQFTSTILLSDMHSFTMIGDLNTTTATGLFAFPGRENFHLYQGSLMINSPVYPIFGETPTSHNSTPDTRGFSDTGPIQRGFLPMSDSSIRTSVREYDGMGMVMNSRVACMRPVITDALLLVDHSFNNWVRLQGILHYGQSLQEARPGTDPLCSPREDCEQVAFDCTMPAALNSTEAWPVTAGCVINGVGGNFRGPDTPAWDPSDGPWSENSSVWLVYSTNMRDEEGASLPPSFVLPSGQPSIDSEWTMYEVVPGYFIKIAMCFSAFNFEYQDIRMTASGATRERSTPWSLVMNEGSNIDEVETYLGLNPSRLATADRGILELQIKPKNSTGSSTGYIPPPPMNDLVRLPADEVSPDAITVDSLQLQMNFQLSDDYTENTTFSLCYHCSIYAIPVHTGYGFLFASILQGKSYGDGRAADALHAFINVAGFNVYNQYLADSMDVAEQVRVVATLEVTAPGSWPPSRTDCAGFIIVGTLLAAWLALVAGISVLYVRHTRYSRYGNVWHVISQLMGSDELGETLELGNNAGDEAVAEGLRTRASSPEDVLVKLGKTEGCEIIKVRKFGT